MTTGSSRVPKSVYIVSGVAITIGMLIIKGLATVINITVAFLLS